VSTRVLWCNPSVGVAGDMLLGSLIDLGADETFVRAQLDALGLAGWALHVSGTARRGLVATAVQVDAPDHDHHRPWSRIDELLSTAELHPEVAAGARRTFRALGDAEATVHGVDIDEVHFHEVGAVDAIVDVVGTWAARVSLEVDRVASAPIGLGAGTAEMAHGRMPVPAPAVLELLVGVPTVGVDTTHETATPTGVALLVTMVERWGAPPPGTVLASGRGAGTWDPPSHPNVVTSVLFEEPAQDPSDDPLENEAGQRGALPHGAPASSGADDTAATSIVEAVVIETNLDDATPEVLAHVIGRSLELGADDAWVTPIVMKKGRPAHLLSVLARPDLADALRELIAAETGTLGLRQRVITKFELPRRTEMVHVDGHRIRLKIGSHGAKAEHDDVVAASAASGRPLRDIAAAALAARALPVPSNQG